MKRAVRAIIVKDNKILVMKRDKFGKTYYTLIGGHVEMGEGLEQALLREVYEKTMIHIANPRQVYEEVASDPYGVQYIFICDYISGEPALHPDADERKINKLGKNIYTPMWLPLRKLPDTPFRSEELKIRLIEHLNSEFPEKIEKYSSIIT